jgi:hypothetical protein
MALEWPRRISTHQRTDIDYGNHIFRCTQYVVFAYVTVHMSVRLIGQCLVLFDPGCLFIDYSSLEATLGSGWGSGVHTSRPVFQKDKNKNKTQILLTGTNLWEYKINLWEQLITIWRRGTNYFGSQKFG